MSKIREWMHGKGRNLVIAVVFVAALAIVLHYFFVERGGQWGLRTFPVGNATATPEISMTPSPTPKDRSKDKSVLTPGDTKVTSPKPETTQKSSDKASATGMFLDMEVGAQEETVTLGFAGDICLDNTSAVMKHEQKKGKGISGCIDPKLIEIMQSNDSMILNNEFAFSDRGTPMKGKAYTFRGATRNVSILQEMGVDAVSLANNHVFDYGETAFLDTLKTLKKASIKYTGGGRDASEAKKPVYIHCKGKTIAIIAATRAEKYILTPEAGSHTPGVLRTYDDRKYVKAIRKAAKKADTVITFVHWGTEYSTELEQEQKQQARDYIDAGADVVIGAHTHCLQGVGYYKGKPIFYSLGNFWFNEKTLYTTLLQLTIGEDGQISGQMLPCIQKDKETKLLTAPNKIRKFVRHINKISGNAKLDKNCIIKGKK